MGMLRPIFDLVAGELRESDPRDYPNNGLVFTPRDFQEILDATLDGDLVQLQIEVNISPTVPEDSPSFARYIMRDWREPERWAVQLVIDHHFDIDKRTILLDEPPQHPLWLRDPDTKRLYGPFDTAVRKVDSGVAVDLLPAEAIPYAPDRDPHTIASISTHTVETVELEHREYLYFTRESFARKTKDWLDFSTDDDIITLIQELAGSGSAFTAAQIEQLREIALSELGSDSKYIKERLKRAASLLDKAAFWQEQRSSLIQEFMQSGRGDEHVERYLQAHQEELVDKAFRKHHALVLENLQKHNIALAELAERIEARKEEIAQLENIDTEALKARRDELESNLKDKREELEHLRSELSLGAEINSLQQELTDRRLELKEVQEQVAALTEERDSLASVSSALQLEANRDISELRDRLVSIKPYVDLLTGTGGSQVEATAIGEPRLASREPQDLAELVGFVHESLELVNHRTARKDVANVLTGILTSPLTILAGLPGVGKTSLVRWMAEILGMAPGSQFLTIRVPRGWRSRQDVLGYHNPITGEYEPAPTGLYPMLRWHNSSALKVPAWVLFDEANLSAPEHYLSDFLGMMDEAADRSLATGAPNEVFEVPSHLRFVFTINQDHSVESLTPRVLDRAAVVYVPPPDSFEVSADSTGPTQFPQETLGADTVTALLQAAPTALNPSEDATLKKLIRVLHDSSPKLGVPTRISPRKHRRVVRHATTMRHMIGVNAGLEALDHAVATHILPLLRGSGATYRARLDGLAREVEGLPVSAGLLARIIAAGEAAFDEYNFQMLA